MLQTENITEVAPGVFSTVLFGPKASILVELLDPALPFVLVWDHQVGSFRWEEFSLPLVEPATSESVISRRAAFDFIVSTAEFLALLPKLRPAIRAVQLARRPPDFLDMSNIKGREMHRLLGEIGWHVLLDTPANDLGESTSRSS